MTLIRKKPKPLKHRGTEEAEEIRGSENRDIGESEKQKLTAEARRRGENLGSEKSETYRGLTRMIADQERSGKQKPLKHRGREETEEIGRSGIGRGNVGEESALVAK